MSSRTDRASRSRRHFLGRLAGALGIASCAALPFGGRRAFAQDETLPRLQLDDPTAKALMYVEDAESASADRGANEFCHNCRYFQGDDDQLEGFAGCQIFPQNSVAAQGWCNVWVEKP